MDSVEVKKSEKVSSVKVEKVEIVEKKISVKSEKVSVHSVEIVKEISVEKNVKVEELSVHEDD